MALFIFYAKLPKKWEKPASKTPKGAIPEQTPANAGYHETLKFFPSVHHTAYYSTKSRLESQVTFPKNTTIPGHAEKDRPFLQKLSQIVPNLPFILGALHKSADFPPETG